MRLSLQTDYALRTLLYLGSRPGRAQIGPLADFYQISRDHVAKVVQLLAKKGFIRSIRGSGGGLELARRPESITVGEVIAEFEGNMHLLECVATENVCVIQSGCKLKHVLARAEQIQMDYLASVTLAEILIDHPAVVPLTLPGVSSP
jgi:Rrf2 family nitric oxide-sensitive transcriptional repressor